MKEAKHVIKEKNIDIMNDLIFFYNFFLKREKEAVEKSARKGFIDARNK